LPQVRRRLAKAPTPQVFEEGDSVKSYRPWQVAENRELTRPEREEDGLTVLERVAGLQHEAALLVNELRPAIALLGEALLDRGALAAGRFTRFTRSCWGWLREKKEPPQLRRLFQP
jgi:hypothetical protein